MRAVTLVIPLPPSANALFANVPRKGRVRTAAYRRWSVAALSWMWTCKPVGGFPFFDGPFSVQIAVPLKMRGDVDNRVKPILDFLKKPAGLVDDDSKTFGATITRSDEVEPGFARVFVFDAPEPIARAA